jgi:imidazolonepropionase
VKADLLVHSAAELITAPPGSKPLVGPDLDRPLLIQDAAVAVVGERIAAIGATADVLAAYPEREAVRVLDARGRLIAPGFVDAHTHLPFAGTREMEFDARARGESYEAIAARGGGIRASVRQLRAIDENALADRVVGRLDTLLRQGITTVEAKSGYGLSTESELKAPRRETGQRAVADRDRGHVPRRARDPGRVPRSSRGLRGSPHARDDPRGRGGGARPFLRRLL